MAQWKSDTQTFDQAISRRYEVMMLANGANGDIVSVTNPLPVTLGSENITITGNVNFVDTVNVASSPENPVHTHITEVGTSGIINVPYLPVGGVVYSDHRPGLHYSFNNHAINVHRGWTIESDAMVPMMSIRCKANISASALSEIEDYELGNNNAAASTIVYEWWEGPLTFGGAAVPSFTSVGTRLEYRFYTDWHSSQNGTTVTSFNGCTMIHSGIIIGRTQGADSLHTALNGTGTATAGTLLTLMAKRVDNGTKLDLWATFNLIEFT